MSGDRFLSKEDFAPASTGPRCSLSHARDARHHYSGTVRPPIHPDERGALVVVELVFSGGVRRAFFPLQGIEQCAVVDLPAVAR